MFVFRAKSPSGLWSAARNRSERGSLQKFLGVDLTEERAWMGRTVLKASPQQKPICGKESTRTVYFFFFIYISRIL